MLLSLAAPPPAPPFFSSCASSSSASCCCCCRRRRRSGAARDEGSHTTRMPHRAQHSRRAARQAEAQHALGGSLFDTLHAPGGSPRDTADGHSLQPAHTAPPPPSSVGLLEQLSERQRAEQQATTSARTAAQPHPPAESPPAAPPASAGHPAGGMHSNAALSNRRQAAYQGLQLLESVCAEIKEEEYVMDVLSRLSLLQHNIHLQLLQRGKATVRS